MANLLRSNKYQALSDEKILKLFNAHPKGEAKYFLQIEIDARGLEEVASLRSQNIKKSVPIRFGIMCSMQSCWVLLWLDLRVSCFSHLSAFFGRH